MTSMKPPAISLYTALSTTVFTLIGFGMSRGIFPNHSIFLYLGSAAAVGVAYSLIHRFMGTRNFEGAIVMAVLLTFLGVLANTIHGSH